MPNKMSQDKIDALLTATGGEPNEKGPGKSIDRTVRTHDFKHPTRVTKDQMRTLENLHSNFARLMASSFSSLQRSVVDVDIAFVDQTTYAEFIMSLSNPSCSYTFSIEPLGGPAVLDFSLPIVYSFINREFGGASKPPNEARIPTSIERSVMGRVVTRALADLEAIWEALLKIQVSDCELETNPEFMQVAAPSDTVVLIAFEVNMQHASGLVNLCYPYFTLEPIMSYLNVQTWASQERGKKKEKRQHRLEGLKNIDTEIRVLWGKGEVSPEEIADLRPGDTLVLETRIEDPGIVFVEDQPLFLGKPGTSSRARNAVEILRSIPQEEAYRNV
ncbi:MAG: flagellar motor switch protein FliM [bacterium]|nr:flagellar motor switch protein FliM [bacterium]